MTVRRAALVVPGSLATLTGGYGYDRHILAGLERLGWRIDVHELDGSFPHPSAAARAHAAEVLESLPDSLPVIVDGLAFGALPDLAAVQATRLRLIALVHHPLAAETGLPATLAGQLATSERRALAAARHVIVTSRATAAMLAAYDVAPDRLTVIEPGTELPRPVPPPEPAVLELLCVATLVPRKGHATLLAALAGLADRAWHLTCVGSDTRDVATARALRELVQQLRLGDRVTFTGELSDGQLARHYAMAQVFVLATHHEGYGMALAEAIAHGLPVISTTAGAVPQTVPLEASLLVPPGDVDALRKALAQLLDEPATRARLAAAARSARERLPTWEHAAVRMAAVLEACVTA